MASVRLEWELNPPEDNTIRYEIERRPIGPSAIPSRINRISYNLLSRNIFGGWRRVGEVAGNVNFFVDDGRMLFRRTIRPTYTHNSEILPYQGYEYQIRAVNNHGTPSPWRTCRVDPIGVGPNSLFIIRGNVSDVHGNPIRDARVTIHHPYTPRFTEQRTTHTGEYEFNLGVTPPAAPLNEPMFCIPGPLHYRIFVINIPLPSVAHPITIVHFITHSRLGPLTPPAAWIPPGYGVW